MKKYFAIALAIMVVIGGLTMAAKKNKPQAPPPTSKEIQADKGIPVETAVITAGNMEQTVEVTGNLAALDQVTLSSKVAGRLAAIYVREGDMVGAGQTVAMLDQDDAKRSLESAQEGLQSALARLSQAKTTAKVTRIQSDATILQAKAALKSANARLSVAKNPARNQEKLVAENRVAAAKANLDNKAADFKRYKQLLDKGAIAEATFDVAQTQYIIAQTDYKSAQEQLAMIKEGGRNEDIETAQAAVDNAEEALRAAEANASQNLLKAEDVKAAIAMVGQAQAAVALAKQQLSYTYIKSPISGRIASRTADPGQVVAPGQAMASVVNLGSIFFKGDVSEKQVAKINVGQRVNVGIDAIPDRKFAGTVVEIYPSGSELSRNFTVRIAINDKSSGVKPGMFARGEIVTAVARNVMLIPKDALDENKGTQSVYTVEDRTAKRHIVEVINENQDYIQVQTPTDLTVGQTVVTQGRQNMREGAKVLLSNDK